MPYQTENYNPPPLPSFMPPRTFEEVRTAIARTQEYLQHLQNADVTYFQHLKENINQNSSTQGQDIVAAATIQPTSFMHVITGAGTITTIKNPLGFSGQLVLISQNGFSLATGGNISLATTPKLVTAGSYIMLVWVPSKQLWYGPV